MPALLSELENNGFVVPNFELSNLKVGQEIGSARNGNLTGDRDKKIFLIIDGFGHNMVEKLEERGRDAAKALRKAEDVKRITTIFPSTTMNVLTSIYGTMPTADHGVVGTAIFLKEAGIMINCIAMAALVNPKGLGLDTYDAGLVFPKGHILDGAKKAERRIKVMYPEFITKRNGQWSMFREENVIPYTSLTEMLVRMAKEVRDDGCDYIVAYYDVFDHIEHVYSQESEEALEEIDATIMAIDRLIVPLLKKHGWNLIITADHGQVKTPKQGEDVLEWNDPVMDLLTMPPWGESRALFMQAKEGMDAKLEDMFEKRWKEHAILIDAEEAIRSGLFGRSAVNPTVRYRFGSHIAIAKGSHSISYLFPGLKAKVFSAMGRHGGLSKDEMEIPLIIY